MGVSWERHGDLIRTQIQETGRVRLSFLTLHDLAAAFNDLGIDPATVKFRDGYAVVENSQASPE